MGLTRDSEGYREYKATYRFKTSDTLDGPQKVLEYIETNGLGMTGTAEALPVPGEPWKVGNDLDSWVWCKWDINIKPVLTQEKNKFWDAEFTFTNKPDNRCQDYKIENPLLEPQKISGGFNKFTEEAYYDRFGQEILNSAYEQMRGPQVEFDRNRPTVKIEQNVSNLELDLITAYMDCVNAYPLWGFPARTIKLSACNWERKFYGSCSLYYTRSFEFEINHVLRPSTTGTGTATSLAYTYENWDREVIDEGSKVLNGYWGRKGNWVTRKINGDSPNPKNPQHFIRFQDRQGNNTRVILNGAGLPSGVITGSFPGTATVGGNEQPIGKKLIQKYHEVNFLLLGIPTSF